MGGCAAVGCVELWVYQWMDGEVLGNVFVVLGCGDGYFQVEQMKECDRKVNKA